MVNLSMIPESESIIPECRKAFPDLFETRGGCSTGKIQFSKPKITCWDIFICL